MAVKYKLKKVVNPRSEYNGYLFARAYQVDEMNLDAIAEMIERNSTAKKSDVLAVLTEFVEVITDALQDSKTVIVDGLGRFKIGLKGHYCEDLEKWNASQYIYGMRVLFQPEYTINADKSRNVALINGAKYEQYNEYDAGVNDNARTSEP